MTYADYFPDDPNGASLRTEVSAAIMQAGPGWCGTFGPDVDNLGQSKFEGNYDLSQMFMLPLVYNYYDELAPQAGERLITLLLARGRIHRASQDDTFTSGSAPNDWSRAGHVSALVNVADIPETENHVLMIATTRYLTNQLLYQRDRDPQHDNRRNGNAKESQPACMDQVLGLLRNYLRDDFAEYNAKNYQEETRHALLNLCSFAYDAEVRLGARMVLDYISAHIAVSSNDLRRMVPFRRRNEPDKVRQIPGKPGVMDVSLLDSHGADPMPAHFALLAGNTRAYQNPSTRRWPDDPTTRPWNWAITPNFGSELTLGALSSYRLPPSIHDLFINDLHRRFFQRLHRHRLEEPGQQRNCDNMEIYAGSPSYLLTAGGKPATWVIPGKFGVGYQAQNLGVAVPNSFMPTGLSARIVPRPDGSGTINESAELIQIMRFSDAPEDSDAGGTINYGVAPDFMCGFAFHLPEWTSVPEDKDGVFFVDRKSLGDDPAGFFLAIVKSLGFILIEAFDTWLHPEVSFEQFQRHMHTDNPNLKFVSGQEAVYTTYFGNRIHYVIWHSRELDNHNFGSKILKIEYGPGNPFDTLVDAGNYTDETKFLSGTVMESFADGAINVHNRYLGTTIALDWSNPQHLVRTSEDGKVEQAGRNGAGQPFEVWVDSDWNGPHEGDFYRPFNNLADAVAAVADGGVIKIAPGATHERGPINVRKRVRFSAPVGGATIALR
jgi:hypothetical protein